MVTVVLELELFPACTAGLQGLVLSHDWMIFLETLFWQVEHSTTDALTSTKVWSELFKSLAILKGGGF